jgi:unsaturated chondroitin disaccharide hydrolase
MAQNIFRTLTMLSIACVATNIACKTANTTKKADPLLPAAEQRLDVDKYLAYSVAQVKKSIAALGDSTHLFPRSIEGNRKTWKAGKGGWTIGFYPGVLWHAYEASKDESIKKAAEQWTASIFPNTRGFFDHDLGFIYYCSAGNALRITKDSSLYVAPILEASDSLITLFDARVGTIHSWPWRVKKNGWPHNTIIDNMMNLEMLFWASKVTGDKKYYDIAVSHAKTNAKSHIRPDYSTYHCVVYDTIDGKILKQITVQGYADNSMWARGQAWAIYGYTMCYRETKDIYFLELAQKLSDKFLEKLPEDRVPFWDYNDPEIPKAPKDASAAAIAASAMYELSTLVKDKTTQKKYWLAANGMMHGLTTFYLAKEKNNAILLRSTGHKTANSEIDVPIIYADYYFLEALLREKNLQTKGLSFHK